jgi:predicted helicase
MKGFREALIHDLTEDDFADMYAQTVTYGLLTARISQPKAYASGGLTDLPITNPFLRDLLSQFMRVGGRKGKLDFDELGIHEVVQTLLDADMPAVLRDFGDKNPQEDPVVHFYELFLKEYDPKKRTSRGVFYTPRPVVSYIVRSVHELLQTEFGLEDGLADTATWGDMQKKFKDLKLPPHANASDPFVRILDPATGTGTFLVECIEVIHQTMVAKWKKEGHYDQKAQDLWNDYVPKHLLPRLYGFELMMAPYAIAHMKVGLKLFETGYRFGADERARIYLTNSLEPPTEIPRQMLFEETALAHEAQAVNVVKKSIPFTVVIGNPPYSGHSANESKWMDSLVRDYYFLDGKPIREANPKYLLDDYVKFFRFAMYQLGQSGAGVLGFITNNGFLDNPTFRGMRQNIMNVFHAGRIINLHGSAKKREVSPDGTVDENVFDIQQGVAISVLCRGASAFSLKTPKSIRYIDVWGVRNHKYEFLLAVGDRHVLAADLLLPTTPYYLLIPQRSLGTEYYLNEGFALTEVFQLTTTGVKTHRDHFAYSRSESELNSRLDRLRDNRISDKLIRDEYDLPDTRDWKLPQARATLRTERLSAYMARCLYRPFDSLHYYASGSIVELPRLNVMTSLIGKENRALGVGRQGLAVAEDLWDLAIISDKPMDANLFRRGGVQVFPLFVYGDTSKPLLQSEGSPNLREGFLLALNRRLGTIPQPCDVLAFIYAQLYSGTYRETFKEMLSIDFPRILLPQSILLFRSMAKLGSELVALHLMEFLLEDEKSKNAAAREWPVYPRLTEFIGKVPSLEIEKVSYAKKTVWLDKAQSVGFQGVPEEVWNFHIGGYQVCEKWLKDRKGRRLSADDVLHYHKIVTALSNTIRLMKEIDAVIEKHGGWPGAFQGQP